MKETLRFKVKVVDDKPNANGKVYTEEALKSLDGKQVPVTDGITFSPEPEDVLAMGKLFYEDKALFIEVDFPEYPPSEAIDTLYPSLSGIGKSEGKPPHIMTADNYEVHHVALTAESNVDKAIKTVGEQLKEMEQRNEIIRN